jgi:hypothetical protein
VLVDDNVQVVGNSNLVFFSPLAKGLVSMRGGPCTLLHHEKRNLQTLVLPYFLSVCVICGRASAYPVSYVIFRSVRALSLPPFHLRFYVNNI